MIDGQLCGNEMTENVWFSSFALSPLSFTSLFVALSDDVLRALIDFQMSLGHLGLRLEKNLCLLDLSLCFYL